KTASLYHVASSLMGAAHPIVCPGRPCVNVDGLPKRPDALPEGAPGLGEAPLETQANMFAGFLLMPGDKIKPLFEREKAQVIEVFKKHKKAPPNDLLLAEYITNPLANVFEVSEASAALRLKNWVNFGR
ncbi:MAG: ImmA/IrrE family metallo-endopeptidase, partial [Deltaproteobacteria bacterium]|nr:ImmA/IrrE family metallo-endopeptidase [Deltaproteobacteria bacterium]